MAEGLRNENILTSSFMKIGILTYEAQNDKRDPCGVFEETGRLVAYKTVLKKRKNRETSISHGIGHGGFEVIFLLGVTYATYAAYAIMINTGTFGSLVDQVMAKAPDQADSLITVASGIASFSFANLALSIVERVFAVLFHIGASIIVFYSCKDKGRFWLYPLAILLHTAMDFITGLTLAGVWNTPTWVLEGILGIFGVLTFCGAFFLLYKKDADGIGDGSGRLAMISTVQ